MTLDNKTQCPKRHILSMAGKISGLSRILPSELAFPIKKRSTKLLWWPTDTGIKDLRDLTEFREFPQFLLYCKRAASSVCTNAPQHYQRILLICGSNTAALSTYTNTLLNCRSPISGYQYEWILTSGNFPRFLVSRKSMALPLFFCSWPLSSVQI